MQGYSGHGVTCTHLAGKLISEVLRGDAERFDAFAKLPHLPFFGEEIYRFHSPLLVQRIIQSAIGWAFNSFLSGQIQEPYRLLYFS